MGISFSTILKIKTPKVKIELLEKFPKILKRLLKLQVYFSQLIFLEICIFICRSKIELPNFSVNLKEINRTFSYKNIHK